MTVEQKCSYRLWQSVLALVCFILVTCNATPVDTELLCPQACICNSTHAKCTSLSGLIKFNTSGVESHFESLDLSNANLRRITSHLEKFSNLTSLDLSHNRLTEVHKLPKGIKVLNLSGNQLTSAKIAKIPKTVEHLNISNNHITYVPYHLKTLKHLRSIELSGNPLNCSCDTLDVRNWLTKKHVWTHRHVVCTAPLQFKGRPWLQVKQAEVCEVKLSPSKYNWDDIEGNELMQGDQPEGSGDGDTVIEADPNYGDDDEDYSTKEEVDEPIMVSSSIAPLEDTIDAEDDDEYEDDDEEPVIVDGKDQTFLPVGETPSSTPQENDDDEVGSGGGITPLIAIEPSPTEDIADDLYTDDDIETSSEPTLGTLGIFGVGVELSSTTPIPVQREVPEETSAPPPPPSDTDDVETVAPPIDGSKENIKSASTDNNRNTFILLGVLGVLLVGLMIYIAMKDKKSRRNRKSKRDIENTPAQELQDMVKPPAMNGKSEHSPLVPETEAKQNGHDKFPAISPEKIPEEPEEEEEKLSMSTFKPDAEQQLPETNNNYPNGELPEVHKEAPLAPKRYSPVYSPRTPKLDRYSPVYTPEGRVKIKLTETPKPKTPIMVNRTRSRAGDYVFTTPEVIIDPVPNNSQNETTTATTNGVTTH